ncbi:MAG: hypothetical protein ACLPQS_12090 [Acidimicrobiales bacterium]
MANRMEIELTSARDDEMFTWRAAGARQPRGLVPTSLLPPRSKVGDVLRAEVEIEIEGITVVSILPPKEKAPEAGRIELLASSHDTPLVTTVLAGGSDRRGPSDRDFDRKPRRGSGDRDGRRRESEGGLRRDDAGRRSASPSARRDDSRRPEAGDRARTPAGGTRTDAGAGRRPERTASTPTGGRREPQTTRTPARRGPVRFEPGTAHRDELFAALTPEQRPIAERLVLGGLPAVRRALTEEQQRARAEGRPAASGESIITIAEQLLPDVKAALWLDRAEAAIGRVDEITLRDLRAAVVGAAARDEAGRTLERELREALDRRVAKLRNDWEQHLQLALADGRVLQALRLSAKPPEPTARFPGSLAVRLAELAGEAMTEETSPERWLSLLEAAVESPVRRQIKPTGMPKDPSGQVERLARMAAGRVPALARLLGMPIPPPPKPVAGERPSRPPRPPRRRPANPAAADPAKAAAAGPANPAAADPAKASGAGPGSAATDTTVSDPEALPETGQAESTPEELGIEAERPSRAVEEPRPDSAEATTSEDAGTAEELSQPVD